MARLPFSSSFSISAPRQSNNSMTGTCPFRQAACKVVMPSLEVFPSSTPAEYLLISSVTTCNSFSDAAFTSRFFPVVSSFSVWIAALWKLLQALRVFIFLIVPRHSNVLSSRNILNKVITKSSREHTGNVVFNKLQYYTIMWLSTVSFLVTFLYVK